MIFVVCMSLFLISLGFLGVVAIERQLFQMILEEKESYRNSDDPQEKSGNSNVKVVPRPKRLQPTVFVGRDLSSHSPFLMAD